MFLLLVSIYNYSTLLLLQAFGVFGLCQIHTFIDYLRSKLTDNQFSLLFRTLSIIVGVVVITAGGTLTALGSIHPVCVCVCACA